MFLVKIFGLKSRVKVELSKLSLEIDPFGQSEKFVQGNGIKEGCKESFHISPIVYII